MNDNGEFVCWNCGRGLSDEPLPWSRHANCQGCFTELHCCRLCRFYDPQAVDECREDRAEPPSNKETANFCEWFAPRAGAYQGDRNDRAASARAELDALFGKSDDAG